MTITTTLTRLRRAGACADGLATLERALGADFGADAPVNALFILRSNGAEHVEWLLQSSACAEDPAPAWAEYLRVESPARDEYLRVTAPALAEYRRVAAQALERILQG